MAGAQLVSVWTWAWIGWLAYFGAVEGLAIVRSVQARRVGKADPHGTLSEHVWLWFGVNRGDGVGLERDPARWAMVRRMVLGGFMIWLTVHFMAGGTYF
jgi:hypothetical protein